jgi:hypothetical protein
VTRSKTGRPVHAPRPITCRRAALQTLGLALAFAIGLPGCGGDAGAAGTVPAGGTVTVNGKPLETGQIQFVPAEGRPASGEIKDGRFTLSTYKDGDGAIPGKHQVAIVATKEVPAKKRGGEPESVSLVPQSYASPAKSNLSIEIPEGGKTDIEIKIQ